MITRTTFRGYRVDNGDRFISIPDSSETLEPIKDPELLIYKCPFCSRKYYLFVASCGMLLEHMRCYFLGGIDCSGILTLHRTVSKASYSSPLMEGKIQELAKEFPLEEEDLPSMFVLHFPRDTDYLHFSDLDYHAKGGLLFSYFEEYLSGGEELNREDFFNMMSAALERNSLKFLNYKEEDFTSTITSHLVGSSPEEGQRVLTLTISNDGIETQSISFLERSFKKLLSIFVDFDNLIYGGNKNNETQKTSH